MNCLLIAFALIPATPATFADSPIGKVSFVNGKCFVKRGGVKKPIKISKGLQVLHGDEPSVKGSASAKMYCFDDCSTNDMKDGVALECKSATASANAFLDMLRRSREDSRRVAFNSPIGLTGKGFEANECLAKILACRPVWWSSPIILKDGLSPSNFLERVDRVNSNSELKGTTFNLALVDLYASRGTPEDRETAYKKIQDLKLQDLSVPERIQVADIYLYNFNFKDSEKFYSEAAKLAHADEDDVGEAIATMGVMFINLAQNRNAETERLRSIQLLEGLGLEDLASLLKKERSRTFRVLGDRG